MKRTPHTNTTLTPGELRDIAARSDNVVLVDFRPVSDVGSMEHFYRVVASGQLGDWLAKLADAGRDAPP